MHRFGPLAFCLALSGCVSMTPRESPPSVTVMSATALDDAANCIVQALNASFAGKLGGKNITHSLEATKLGETYEVRPQQTLAPAGEAYFVRLTKQSPTSTKIEAFRLPAWAKEVDPAVQSCSGA